MRHKSGCSISNEASHPPFARPHFPVSAIMGCQHSTPAPTEADYLVEHPRPVALLYKSLTPAPAGCTCDFEVAKKCWSVKTPVGLQKDLQFAPMEPLPEEDSGRLVLVLQDGLSKPLAVLVMEDPKKLRIQICSFVPSTEHQKSCGEHQGRPIYQWAVAEEIRNSKQFSMVTTADNVYYRTDLYGPVSAHVPVKLVIKRQGVLCASVEEEKKKKQWKCKVGPGIDPAVMICFVACYDKFCQVNDEMLNGAHRTTTYSVSNVF